MSTDTDRRKRFETIAEEVFEPLQRFLRRRTNPTDAEDLLSDVLLTIWRRLDYVPADNTLPWTYGVARKVLANHNRSARRRLRLAGRLELERVPAIDLDPAEAGPDPDLAAALSSLGDEDHEIVRLWAWEQLEPREIGPVLGISVNAATLRLSRARKKLAAKLERQDVGIAGHQRVESTQEQRDE